MKTIQEMEREFAAMPQDRTPKGIEVPLRTCEQLRTFVRSVVVTEEYYDQEEEFFWGFWARDTRDIGSGNIYQFWNANWYREKIPGSYSIEELKLLLGDA